MLKGLGDLGQIVKIQKEFKNVQKKIQTAVREVESPGGEVKVRINGEYRILDIKLSKELMEKDPGEAGRLITETINTAVDRIKEFSTEEMQKLTGGLDIPGLNGLLGQG